MRRVLMVYLRVGDEQCQQKNPANGQGLESIRDYKRSALPELSRGNNNLQGDLNAISHAGRL